MCIEGKQLDSVEFSRMITDGAAGGVSRLCFIIGSSHGLHGDVKLRAEYRLSMSNMTFPHGLARVMLLEQIYRGLKIAEGGKYHK
jgi:23S rRNA (pseudouridine1915-N3)-methyltransferase